MKFYQQIILVGISLGIGGFFVTWLTSWLQKKREIFWLKYNLYSEANYNLNVIINFIESIIEIVKRTDPNTLNVIIVQIYNQKANEISNSYNRLTSLIITSKNLYKDENIKKNIEEIENFYKRFTAHFEELGLFNQMRALNIGDSVTQLLINIINSKSQEILNGVYSIRKKFFEIQNLIFKELKITRKIIKN